MNNLIDLVLSTTKALQNEVPKIDLPPKDGSKPKTEQVLDSSITRNTRGYIEKVVDQINGSYEHGWFDCCAVMIRRLIETLIIEVYEKYGISDKIKNQNDDFFYLSEMIDNFLG